MPYHRGRARYSLGIDTAVRPRRGRSLGKRAVEVLADEACTCRVDQSTYPKRWFRDYGIFFVVGENLVGAEAVARATLEATISPARLCRGEMS